MNKKNWHILLEKHNTSVYEARVNINSITENELNGFMKTLLSKYCLTDDEILEQHLQIPFKKKKEYIKINRRSNKLAETLQISFDAQVADYSLTVCLIE